MPHATCHVQVLERDPGSVKALFRRAMACVAQHDYVRAREDLTRAAKLEPANREVGHLHVACACAHRRVACTRGMGMGMGM